MPALNAQDAAHLLRRSGFGGGGSLEAADRAAITGLERAAAADLILSTANITPGDPAAMYDENIYELNRLEDAQLWWLERMRTGRVAGRTAGATAASPVQEKLALFWHSHFPSGHEKLGSIQALYWQNKVFRTMGMGSFQDLALAVSTQRNGAEALLGYLDNHTNVVGNPNENFARELMELFTMGVNKYTQQDVEESARAWTGWTIGWPIDYNPLLYFSEHQHDSGQKTFMGITKNWNGPDIIQHLCTGTAVNPTTGEAPGVTTSRFVARKLWSFFAYPNPDAALVESLAANWRANGLVVSALLRDIFTRDEFYSSTAKLGLVRSPVEFVVAALRSTGLSARTAIPHNMADMGQAMFYPPDVSGWKQNGYWVTTTGHLGASHLRVGSDRLADGSAEPSVPRVDDDDDGAERGAGRIRRLWDREPVGGDPQPARDVAHRPTGDEPRDRMDPLPSHQPRRPHDAEPRLPARVDGRDAVTDKDYLRARRELWEPATGPNGMSRRKFLQALGVGTGAALAAPSLLSRFEAFAADDSSTDGILVLVMLAGGNDGLNTLVPFNDPKYHALRPVLGYNAPGSATRATLSINDPNLGLHPSLTRLKARYLQNQVAFVNGVGYNPPDMSHFNSMGFWMNGWKDAPPMNYANGWVGRYMDTLPGASTNALLGACIGSSVPVHMIGSTARAAGIPQDISGAFGLNRSKPYDARMFDAFAAYGDTPTGKGQWAELVAKTNKSTMTVAQSVQPAYAGSLGDDDLVQQLTLVARLINLNLGTRRVPHPPRDLRPPWRPGRRSRGSPRLARRRYRGTVRQPQRRPAAPGHPADVLRVRPATPGEQRGNRPRDGRSRHRRRRQGQGWPLRPAALAHRPRRERQPQGEHRFPGRLRRDAQLVARRRPRADPRQGLPATRALHRDPAGHDPDHRDDPPARRDDHDDTTARDHDHHATTRDDHHATARDDHHHPTAGDDHDDDDETATGVVARVVEHVDHFDDATADHHARNRPPPAETTSLAQSAQLRVNAPSGGGASEVVPEEPTLRASVRVVVVGDVAHVVVDVVLEREVLAHDRGQTGVHVREGRFRWRHAMVTPHHHRYRTDLAFRDPTDVVFVEPGRDARRLAEVAVLDRPGASGIGHVAAPRPRSASCASSAARSSATNVAAASGPPPWSRRRTSALPTITPSADSAASHACSGVEIPTPRSTGRSVTALQRRPISPAWVAKARRSPVTPISATP